MRKGGAEQDQEEQESKEEKKIQDNHENDCQGDRRDFEGEARDTPHPLVSTAKNLFSPVIRLQYLLNALPGEPVRSSVA